MSLPAYNAQFAQSDADAYRIARNIQLVLKEESYLGKVIDPAGGTYFVEALTDQLADKAWPIFQEIEAAGGWYSYLQQDQLQQSLSEGKRKRTSAVSTGSKTILGTNHFPNELETLPATNYQNEDLIEKTAIAQRMKRLGATLGIVNPPFEGNRLALPFEQLRLKMQEMKKANPAISKALLLTIGDPVMRAARANFARNVLAAGGFTCAENAHPADLQAAMIAAKSFNPAVVVLCGADGDYLEKGGEWLFEIKKVLPDAVLLLAGKPEGWEKLKENGISEPIFAGMDRVNFLERLLETLKQRKEARA